MRTRSNRKPSFSATFLIILTLIANIPIFPLRVQAGEPIPAPILNKFNTHFSITDILISSYDLPIQFSRTYNSGYNHIRTPLGYGWSHSYDITLEQKENDLIIFKDSTSKRYAFKKELDGSFITPPNINATLNPGPDKSYILTFRNKTAYLFNAAGQIEKIKTRNRNYLVFTYSENRNLLSVSASSGAKIDFTYDKENRITKVKGSNSRIVQYVYDSNSDLIKAINFLGDVLGYAYDKDHNVTLIRDQTGRKTQFNYDKNGNLASSVDPADNKTQYEFISSGYNLRQDSKPTYFSNTLTTIDPKGNKTQTTYDDLGHTISFTDKKGNKTLYEYDRFGNMTAVIDPMGRITEYIYDEDSNLIAIRDPLRNEAQLLYDGKNQLIELKGANGNKTEYSYDGNGNLIEIKDAAGGITSMDYTTQGALKLYYDPNGNKTSFIHDKFGRLVNKADAKGNLIKYEYDETGALVKITDQQDKEKQIIYDWPGRYIKVLYPDNKEYVYTYNATGKLTNVQGPEGVVAFEYNELGLPTQVIDTNGQTTKYGYDALGRKVEMTDPTGTVTRYEYDVDGMLVSLIQPDEKTIKFGYDALKRRISVLYPNNVETTYKYDNASNLLQIKCENLLTKMAISRTNYTYDSLSNCILKEDSSGETTYKYDSLSRLIEVTKSDGLKISYSYDKAGNRLTQTTNGIEENYAYNELNQLVVQNDTAYEYDNKGNLIAKIEKDAKTQYYYNHDNFLEKAALPEGKEVTFNYDPLKRRIAKIATDSVTKYCYDMQDTSLELDGQNKPIVKYINGPGVDDVLASQNLVNNEQTYFTHDNIGSIGTVLDHKGDIKESFTYGPFGELTQTTQKQSTTPRLFTGRQFDPETNLYYYRNRYYSPETGRFITQDPIGLLGGANLYAYCLNNPINYVDPLGLATITVYANDRSPGSFGHAWATITNDNGTSVTWGNYPGGPSSTRDNGRVGDASFTWTISQSVADAIAAGLSAPGYVFRIDNCVDRIEGALDFGNISHPNFDTLGISDPHNVVGWLNGLNAASVPEPPIFVLIGLGLVYLLSERKFRLKLRRR